MQSVQGVRSIVALAAGLVRVQCLRHHFSRCAVQESPVAMKIKDTFMGEKGLAGKVKKLPYDKVFKLENVKAVSALSRTVWLRRAVQPHAHTLAVGAAAWA